jgi:S-adenosylmethionine synthetase
MASEAAAGKNPVSHVGKIYNLLSFRLANRIYEDVPGCREVYTWLLSEIGRPINEPKTVSVQIVPVSGIDKYMLASAEEVVADEFDHLDEFCRDLYMQVTPVC